MINRIINYKYNIPIFFVIYQTIIISLSFAYLDKEYDDNTINLFIPKCFKPPYKMHLIPSHTFISIVLNLLGLIIWKYYYIQPDEVKKQLFSSCSRIIVICFITVLVSLVNFIISMFNIGLNCYTIKTPLTIPVLLYFHTVCVFMIGAIVKILLESCRPNKIKKSVTFSKYAITNKPVITDTIQENKLFEKKVDIIIKVESV